MGKSDVTSWLRVSRDASGRPSRDASRRSFLQITKPMGFVIATGVLTVARFVGKVGCYLLVASLSGRLRASLSGRLTAFHPPDHKAGGSRHRDGGVLTVARFVGKVGCYLLVASLSGRLRASLSGRLTAFLPPDHKADGFRHCDGGTHGGEICWESRMLPLGCESLRTPQGVPLGTPHGVPPPRSQSRWVPSSRRGALGGEICPSRELDDPLASQQPCRGLLGPEALPLVGRAPGCDLSDPSQVMEPRGPTSHTAMAMDPVHGNQSSFGSTDVTLTAQ